MNTDSPTSRPLVVLLTFGTGGDLQPFIVMAAELAARGYRTFLVVPRFHEQAVKDAGLPFATYGTHQLAQSVLDDPDVWDERKGLGVIWRGVLPSLDEIRSLLVSCAQAGPCAVLCHPFLVPVAAIAKAQQSHLRLVCTYLAPSNLRTVHDPLTMGSLNVPTWVPRRLRAALWRFADRTWIDPALLPGLNAFRAQHGLGPIASYLPHMEAAGDASVGLFPAWFARRQPDWPAGFVEGQFPLRPALPSQPLPAALEDFLAAGDPPIVFTPGTGHRHASRYFANALSALQALGKRGLFLTAYGEQVPRLLPPGVQWFPYAPFDRLLPRVSLLVHHGGIGTTAEALRAGVPQLIVPFAFDQFDNGRRVQALNAGRMLPAARANARRLVKEIDRLLADAKQAERGVRPGALPVASALEQLVDSVERVMACKAGGP